MRRYLNLINKKAKLSEEIKEEKRRLHNSFVKAHKKEIRLLDIAMVLVILFNFGALVTTNIMVIEKVAEVAKIENTPVVFVEVNPQAAKAGNYEPIPDQEEGKNIIRMFIIASLYWVFIISLYIYFRKNLYSEAGLFIMFIAVTYFFVLFGRDFFHDIGYFIGKMMYGV